MFESSSQKNTPPCSSARILYVWATESWNNTTELVCSVFLQCLHWAVQGVPCLCDTSGSCHIRWGTKEFRRWWKQPWWSQSHQQGKNPLKIVNASNQVKEKQFAEEPGFSALCFLCGAHLEMAEPSVLYSLAALGIIYLLRIKNYIEYEKTYGEDLQHTNKEQ